jgi:hypothetical protein
MDALLIAIFAPVVSAALTGLITSVLTTRSVTAVMDQKVSDVTRRVGVLEDVKLDKTIHAVTHEAIGGRIDAALEEISRERHRVNNLMQGKQP